MINMLVWLSFLALKTFCSETSPKEIPWLEKKAEGWPYYEEHPIEKKEEKKSIPNLKAKPQELTEREKLTKIKEDLEEKLAAAILNPTAINIEAYIRAQQSISLKSELFAKEWRKILLDHPELDTTISEPVSQYGIAINHQKKNFEIEQTLHELSNRKILLFFYDRNCLFSQGMLPTITNFSKRYNWQLFGISENKSKFEEIPNLDKTDKMVSKIKIEYLPALMLFDPKTEEIKPIGWGFLTRSQIEENILEQCSPGQNKDKKREK